MRLEILILIILAANLLAPSEFSSGEAPDMQDACMAKHANAQSIARPTRTTNPLFINRTTSPPYINGLMGANEWTKATVVNISADGLCYLYIMFDSTRLYICVDVPSDTTNDQGNYQSNEVVQISIDGDNDGIITQLDSNGTRAKPITYQHWFTGEWGQCEDRWAQIFGDGTAKAGYLNRNSAGEVLLYTMNDWVTTNPTEDPYDLAKAGFMNRRIYEYSFPFSGSQEEIYGDHYSLVGLTVLVNDEMGDSDANTWTTRGIYPPNADALPIDGPFGKVEFAQAPSISIISPSNGAGYYLGNPTPFDAVVTDDYYLGGALAYLWDFGDGASSTSKTVSHTYASVGSYQAKLRVTDDEGLMDEKHVTVVISEMNYPPAIVSRYPTAGFVTTIENSSINFSISASDPNANDYLITYWYVNDSEREDARESTFFLFPSIGDFFCAGSYRIRATVRDSFGLETSTSWNVSVEDFERPPRLTMHFPVDYEVRTNETTAVTFRVNYYDADNEPARLEWYVNGSRIYGEGERNYTYLGIPNYDAAGRRSVACKVVDWDNASAFVEVRWNVTVDDVNRPPTIARVEPSSTEVTVAEGSVVNFAVDTRDPDIEDACLSAYWYLDNALVNITYSNASSSYVAMHSYRPDYNASGIHTIEVIVSDRGGCTRSIAWDVIVENTNRVPVVRISKPEMQSFELNAEIAFDASDSYDEDHDPISYKWDFGDGNYSNGAFATHRYAMIGDYTVTLNVSDGKSYSSMQMSIGVHAPVLSISVKVSATNVSVGKMVVITAYVSNSGNEASQRNIVRISADGRLLSNSSIPQVTPGGRESLECSWKVKGGKRIIAVELLPVAYEMISKNNDTVIVVGKLPPPADYSFFYELAAALACTSCACLAAFFVAKRRKRIMEEREASKRKELNSLGTLIKPSLNYSNGPHEISTVEYAPEEVSSISYGRPPEAPKVKLSTIVGEQEYFASVQAARDKLDEARGLGVFVEDAQKRLESARQLFEMGRGREGEKACDEIIADIARSREKHDAVARTLFEVEHVISQAELMGCDVALSKGDVEKARELAAKGEYDAANEHANQAKMIAEKASKEKLSSVNYGTVRVCETCGMELVDEWSECPNCSGAMSSACPSCGGAIEPDFVQCPYCNSELKKIDNMNESEETKVKNEIYEASAAILDAEKADKNISEAKNTLVLAVSFLRSRKYEKAIRYAKRAKEYANK